MRRKCNTCLCRTCMNTCCDFKGCGQKKESCEKYNGFRQVSIFDSDKPIPNPHIQYQPAPRHPWRYYDIDKKRYNQLVEHIRSGRYDYLALSAARRSNEMIAEYFIMSIKKNLSYDDLERMWTLGEIERIPVGRSDFYGWRRYYIHIFDMELRRIGK